MLVSRPVHFELVGAAASISAIPLQVLRLHRPITALMAIFSTVAARGRRHDPRRRSCARGTLRAGAGHVPEVGGITEPSVHSLMNLNSKGSSASQPRCAWRATGLPSASAARRSRSRFQRFRPASRSRLGGMGGPVDRRAAALRISRVHLDIHRLPIQLAESRRSALSLSGPHRQ